jgi:TonB family protein
MNAREFFFPDEKLFQRCLGISLAAHILFLIVGPYLHLPDFSSHPVEIDLTMTSPLPGTGPAKLGAPKKLVPNAPKVQALPDHGAVPAQVAPVTSAKDWVLPAPGIKKVAPPPVEAPVIPHAPEATTKVVNPATPGGEANGAGTSALTGGHGQGADIGTPNGLGDGGSPVVMPKLLNGKELIKILRRFYPESERAANREGHVMLYIHIDETGKVTSAEVARSSGAQDFDAAALKAAPLMKFSPARSEKGPVPVKLPGPIDFVLDE